MGPAISASTRKWAAPMDKLSILTCIDFPGAVKVVHYKHSDKPADFESGSEQKLA